MKMRTNAHDLELRFLQIASSKTAIDRRPLSKHSANLGNVLTGAENVGV
jgi:hypothetical protein